MIVLLHQHMRIGPTSDDLGPVHFFDLDFQVGSSRRHVKSGMMPKLLNGRVDEMIFSLNGGCVSVTSMKEKATFVVKFLPRLVAASQNILLRPLRKLLRSKHKSFHVIASLNRFVT